DENFESFDMTNNSITKLSGFPFMPNVKSLFLSNNRIVNINFSTVQNLPNLEVLILTNNVISELTAINCLEKCKKLTILSLLNNPITTNSLYRPFMIFKIPSLRYLDFRKIKQSEREAASKLFASEKLKKVVQSLNTTDLSGGIEENREKDFKMYVPGESHKIKLSKEELNKIKQQIANAKTFEEVSKLNEFIKRKKLEA
ncbi:MAG: U2 small nuclear ribonucleoprotein A', partial [Paramarteilia canceri]